MNRLLIKHLLIDKGMSYVDLARATGIGYDRLVRIVHGYRKARSEELEAINGALRISCEAQAAVETKFDGGSE